VMDGALQAAVGLVEGEQLQLPFALETLRMISPCTPHMFAWVRYDKALKVDIDLCDEHGNVCVQMRGLSLRAAQRQAVGSLLATPVWQASEVGADHIDYADHHVIRCESQHYNEYALSCFERIQAILRSKPQGKVLVQVVGTEVLLAGLSGLLKTAALENPQIVGQLILVPAETTDEELARYLEAEKAHGPDPLIRYEEGRRQVWRWEEVAAESEQPPIAFKDDGVYLITGGRGGLGVVFTKEILEQTREGRVVLTGRTAWSPASERVSYRQVDLGELDQVKQLIAGIQEEYGKLNGILHGAGMIADNFILKKSSAEFREVLLPKVTGTFHLDQASQDVELDFFVLFSSIAGALGNVGQADYACANSFMDQFAAYRNRQVAANRRHGRTRSINWPLWQGGGMKMDGASQEVLQQTTGMRPMQTATGIEAFYRSLALPYDQILVAEGDRSQMRRALLDGSSPPQPAQRERDSAKPQ